MRMQTTGGKTRRQLYEDRLRRRSLLIAGGSTALVILAIFILVPMAPGW
jgi:polar amino acid transport system permease protein